MVIDTSHVERVPSRVVHTRTYSVAVALAYARAFDRGLELELGELLSELDRARDAETRCLDEDDLPAKRASRIGYEHAQKVRMEGERAMPGTFVV